MPTMPSWATCCRLTSARRPGATLPSRPTTWAPTPRRPTTGRCIGSAPGAAASSPCLGLSTGLPRLDAALKGLRGLTILGGCAGDGKTTLALNAVVEALRAHPDVAALYYTLDMSKGVLYDRLLCREAGITYEELAHEHSRAEMWQRVKKASGSLRDGVLPRLRFVEQRQVQAEGALTAERLFEHRHQLLRATGAARALVVVDFLGKIEVGGKNLPPLEQDNRRVEVLESALSRSAASPNSDASLVISEVRKERSDRSLSVEDLLGSCRLGYSADAETALLLVCSAGRSGPRWPLARPPTSARRRLMAEPASPGGAWLGGASWRAK